MPKFETLKEIQIAGVNGGDDDVKEPRRGQELVQTRPSPLPIYLIDCLDASLMQIHSLFPHGNIAQGFAVVEW